VCHDTPPVETRQGGREGEQAGAPQQVRQSPVTAGVLAVLLDFDGLILDTETPIFEEWRAEFRGLGAELTLLDWQHSLGTHGGLDPVALLEERSGQRLDREAVVARVRARNQLRCDALPLLPGVLALVQEARALRLGTAVASSSTEEWVLGWLGRHGLRDFFDVVCARDHVRQVKPAPDLFLLAAARLSVPPACCLVFEDSPNGIRAAKAAGMRCVAVPGPLTRPLDLPGPDLVLDTLADAPLRELIKRLGSA
jgi:HAD superfamily hydrolase (TIGR01509 family)